MKRDSDAHGNTINEARYNSKKWTNDLIVKQLRLHQLLDEQKNADSFEQYISNCLVKSLSFAAEHHRKKHSRNERK